MRFIGHIPGGRKAFDIPGTRTELRITIELPETEVPKALRLVLLRGQLFRLFLQEVIEDEGTRLPERKTNGGVFRREGPVLELWASVSPRDSAIRISGLDGMQITFQLPMLDDRTLVQLLALREKQFELYIPERASEKVKTVKAEDITRRRKITTKKG